jgi:hypothetical protein
MSHNVTSPSYNNQRTAVQIFRGYENYVALLTAKTKKSGGPLLYLKLLAATSSQLIYHVNVVHRVAAGSAK